MKRYSFALACVLCGGLGGAFLGRPLLQGQAQPAPASAPKELTSYRDIVKKVLPAVVSIESRTKVTRARRTRPLTPFDDQQLPPQLRRFFENMPREQPDEDDDSGPGRLGFGSGFVVDPKGVILTNHHVVDGADQVEVRLLDGRKFVSKDVKSDPKTDLAIVRIQPNGALPYLELGDSNQMEIGDRVLAVGAPFGLTGSVTHGIISGKGRSLRMNLYEDFLQTDAPINPGNSGGPLVNLEGQVIAINSAIKSRSGGFQGVGMAIASNLAKNIMPQLLKDGVVHRGYLGVQIRDVEDGELATRLGLQEPRGVLVMRVFDDAPGAKGGIKEGDVIVSLDGKQVKDGRELQTIVAGLAVGKSVDVGLVRDGKTTKVSVKIEEQPQEFGATRVPTPRAPERETEAVSVGKIGVQASDLTPEVAERLGFRENLRGALLTRVDSDGLAAEAGLRRGMVITSVDRKPVTSADKLNELVAAGSLERGLLLQVHGPEGGTNFVLLKTGPEATR